MVGGVLIDIRKICNVLLKTISQTTINITSDSDVKETCELTIINL